MEEKIKELKDEIEKTLSDEIIKDGHFPETCRLYHEEDVKKHLQDFKGELKKKLKYNLVEKEDFISLSEEAFNRDVVKDIDKQMLKHFGDKLI